MPREIITISLGQCGNQIAWRFWDLLLREHAAAACGAGGDDLVYDDCMSTFFRNVDEQGGRDLRPARPGSGPVPIRSLRARAILVDMEEGVVSQLLRSPIGGVFDASQLVTDVSGAGNNWAHGYCGYGPQYRGPLLEQVRRSLEACESPQSFFLMHSLGGGTGSGVGTYLTEQLRDAFPELYRFTTALFPSPDDDVVTSPYNFGLALGRLVEAADCILPLENAAMADIVGSIGAKRGAGGGGASRVGGTLDHSSTLDYVPPPAFSAAAATVHDATTSARTAAALPVQRLHLSGHLWHPHGGASGSKGHLNRAPGGSFSPAPIASGPGRPSVAGIRHGTPVGSSRGSSRGNGHSGVPAEELLLSRSLAAADALLLSGPGGPPPAAAASSSSSAPLYSHADTRQPARAAGPGAPSPYGPLPALSGRGRRGGLGAAAAHPSPPIPDLRMMSRGASPGRGRISSVVRPRVHVPGSVSSGGVSSRPQLSTSRGNDDDDDDAASCGDDGAAAADGVPSLRSGGAGAGRRGGTAWDGMNNLAAHLLTHLTASMRFPGPLNVDLNEVTSTLVPFPRLNLLQASVTPLYALADVGVQRSPRRVAAMFSDAFTRGHQLIRGDPKAAVHLAAGLLVRGDLALSDVTSNVERLKGEIRLARWNPDGFKVGLCARPPLHQPYSLLALSNNTSVVGALQAGYARFAQLYRVRAHTHHYTEYMEPALFTEALQALGEVISGYNEIEAMENGA